MHHEIRFLEVHRPPERVCDATAELTLDLR